MFVGDLKFFSHSNGFLSHSNEIILFLLLLFHPCVVKNILIACK